jgi:hypothetical protein
MIHARKQSSRIFLITKAIKFLCVLRVFAVSLFASGMNRHSDVMTPRENDNRAADIMSSLQGLNHHKCARFPGLRAEVSGTAGDYSIPYLNRIALH